MENPVAEIEDVVRRLTQGSPRTQEHTIRHYFLPNASFKHPFCSVFGNREAILRIFQWYKILSPHIDITINSVAFDDKHLTLYVNISQVFRIFFVPLYRAPVTLTTVLQLVHGPNLNKSSGSSDGLKPKKYYIQSQNDLYQVDQFVRFVLPWGIGTTIVLIWHWITSLCCIIGARLGAPLRWNNQVLADAHPSYPDVHHARQRSNASEILQIHGRANGIRPPEVGVTSDTVTPDWEASWASAESRQRRPGSLRSI